MVKSQVYYLHLYWNNFLRLRLGRLGQPLILTVLLPPRAENDELFPGDMEKEPLAPWFWRVWYRSICRWSNPGEENRWPQWSKMHGKGLPLASVCCWTCRDSQLEDTLGCPYTLQPLHQQQYRPFLASVWGRTCVSWMCESKPRGPTSRPLSQFSHWHVCAFSVEEEVTEGEREHDGNRSPQQLYFVAATLFTSRFWDRVKWGGMLTSETVF